MDVCAEMSPTETPPRCGFRALADSVSELLTGIGEEILGLLEKRGGCSGSTGASGRLFQRLRLLLAERTAAAAQRIVDMLEREVEGYWRQLERQRRLLEALLSPVVRLNRTDAVRSPALKIPTDDDLPLLSDPTHTPSGPPSPASSEVSADESDGDWGGSASSKDTGTQSRHFCVVCGKAFRQKKNLVKHAGMHSDSPEHPCGVCGQRFECCSSLSGHLASHRENLDIGGTCEVCGRRFQNMEAHMRSHTGVKPFSCDFCSKRFPRPGALSRHKKIHSRRSPYACQVCGLTFTGAEPLREHLKTHNHDTSHTVRKDGESTPKTNPDTSPAGKSAFLSCRVCGNSFHGPGILRKHAETHSKEPHSPCGVCGEQLDSPDGLRTHLRSHGETGGTCGICGKTFRNTEAHMRSHTGVKPYRCGVCCKRFPRPGALRRHKKIHSGERPHVCRQCGKAFAESCALKTHSRSHSCQDQDASPPGDRRTARTPQSSCKVCGEPFRSGGRLRKHARSHSAESACGVCGESLRPSETLPEHLQTHREAGQVCHVCGRSYQNVETHMRSHTGIKPYRCSTCGKSFPRPGALRRHGRIHSSERPYICEFCGKTFLENGALTAHIRNHTGDKPASRVSCETCGKSLASAHVLEVHKRIHTGEKPFLCRVCGKAFRQVGGLNAHTLTHTGEKPFSCSLCGKSFSTKGYLETHIRFHRKERAFSCQLCWKAFVTKNDLKKHLLTHTGEKPHSCRVCGKSYQEKRSRDVHMKVHQGGKEPIRRQDLPQPDFIQL